MCRLARGYELTWIRKFSLVRLRAARGPQNGLICRQCTGKVVGQPTSNSVGPGYLNPQCCSPYSLRSVRTVSLGTLTRKNTLIHPFELFSGINFNNRETATNVIPKNSSSIGYTYISLNSRKPQRNVMHRKSRTHSRCLGYVIYVVIFFLQVHVFKESVCPVNKIYRTQDR